MKREVEVRKRPTVDESEIKDTVGFMVRIHEGRFSNLEIKDTMRKLGLRKKYDGCFVKLDAAGLGQSLYACTPNICFSTLHLIVFGGNYFTYMDVFCVRHSRS